MQRLAFPRTSREAWVLCALCTLDMVSSACLFQSGLAVEANPLLRPFADAGLAPFVLAKSATFLPAVLYLHWLHRHRPAFTRALVRWAIAGYTALYIVPSVAQWCS